MKGNPRFLFWLIVFITLASIIINLPNNQKISIGPVKNLDISSSSILSAFRIDQKLEFRRGLDLKGGTSITFKADMAGVSDSQKSDALNSAKTVIEKRINLFGVSEPVIQTAAVNGDSRIIVELPGVTDVNQAISLIGTTAQLSFWEEGSTESAKTASPAAYPLGIVEVLGPGARKTNLTGNDLESSSVAFDPNTGNPQVQLVFTSGGSKKFADITKRNINKIVAIVLDDQVIEAPRVNQAILTGDAVITGGFTLDQAKILGTELNAGALPVPLSVLEQRVIGPTLGIESLKKSLLAGVVGFLIIVIFMSVLYGRLGIVASLALIVYSLLTLSIFKISNLTPYGITLTLSGIAGFILSIGMAVDANILIFERIKEEKRLGKRQEESIEIGFSRAWPSIRDSNVSTLITSAILYQFGTGVVKGFALVLAIGVLVSMFSAIVVTRTFLRFFYEK